MPSLPQFTRSSYIVKNIANKTVNVLGYRVRPGQKVDLFAVIPGLKEADIVEANRIPNGDIYRESVVKRTIEIRSSSLVTLKNDPVGSFTSITAGNLLKEETSEELTLYINPDTGTDPAVNTPTRIYTQAQSSAYGYFASVRGAIRTIPSFVRHDITFQISDGSYAISDLGWFNGLEKLDVSAGTKINIVSESKLVKIAGTVTSTVQSNTTGYSLVLAEDPGYVDDVYQGKWLKIVSGTGEGQYKPIRTHSGTSIIIAGKFEPIDNTSQVEVYEPPVIMDFGANTVVIRTPNITNIVDDVTLERGLIIRGIEMSASAVQFYGPGSITFDATTLEGSPYFTSCNDVSLNHLIVHGGFALVSEGSFIRGGHTESAWYIYDCTAGMFLNGFKNSKSTAFLFRGAVDDCALGAFVLFDTYADMYSAKIRGTGCPVGLSVQRGSRAHIDISNLLISGVTASTADIEIGGDVEKGTAGLRMSYTDLGNIRSAVNQPNGNLNGYFKVLQVESSTTTGTGTLAYTSGTTTVTYTAPSDSAGSGVDVSAGGEFILKSNNGKWIKADVNPTLPVGDASDTFTVAQAGAVIENNTCVIELY